MSPSEKFFKNALICHVRIHIGFNNSVNSKAVRKDSYGRLLELKDEFTFPTNPVAPVINMERPKKKLCMVDNSE